MFGIWCVVSGGVTGHREAWLKSLGDRVSFASRKEAEDLVATMTERKLNDPHRKAAYRYSVREIGGE
jgi:hypothetical protein